MRTINISTDTYAKIWSLRQAQEENEEDILSRVLFLNLQMENLTMKTGGLGFSDARHNVHFAEGFEISRKHLGSVYKAVATAGQWKLLNNGCLYGSLNELSKAIGAKTENAWVNWNYTDEHNRYRKVSELRGSNYMPLGNPIEKLPRISPSVTRQFPPKDSWAADLMEAFLQLNQEEVPLKKIYDQVQKIRSQGGRSVPASLDATVRERLESHSSDSENYKGDLDLFFMPRGKGHGIWSLREQYRVSSI
jgi:hypothetical protein